MPGERTNHCFNCGAEIGSYKLHHPLDTCGRLTCERAARDALAAEREEAHEQLDRDRGW